MQADSFKEFGKRIREERAKNNFTISDISKKTRISLKMLNILENGERDRFIAPVLMAGFLRNYMKAIGSNADEWVKQLKPLFLKEEEEQKEAGIKKMSAKKIRRKNAGYIAILLFIIIATYLIYNITDYRKTGLKLPIVKQQLTVKKLVVKPIAKPKKKKQKIVPLFFTLKIKTAKERSWIFYKIDNDKSKTGFIDANQILGLKAKNNLLVTIGNSKGTQILFNDNKIRTPSQVIHLKCIKSGCSLLSASEWQNIIFQYPKNAPLSANSK